MKKLLSLLTFSFLALALAMPSSVFAATHTWGIHSSVVGGGATSVTSDADGSHLVAASNDTNIWVSDDSGATWTNRPLPADASASSVRVISDATGQNLVASEQSAGIYTSTNRGVTWTRRQPGGEDIGSRYMAINSDGSIIGVTGGSDLFFWTSDDGGATWDTHATPDYFSYLSPTTDGTHFVAATFSGSVWTSSNGGVNWTDRSLAGTFWQLGSNPDGSNLIVSNGTRLYTSSNNGANWTERQPAGDIDSTWSVASDADGLNLIVGGGSGGGHIYTSPDGGVTWFEESPQAGSVASDADSSHLMAGTGVGLFTSPDTIPPTVSSLTPADDANEVIVNATFDVVFNEDIATSTGDITLHLVSDDSLVETIDVAGPKVTLSDTDTLTIDPTTTLETGTEYYFLIDVGAVEDIEGNPFAGISDPTDWSFTTDTAPTLSSLTPLDNATDVVLNLLSNGNAYAQFDQNVVAGTGNVTLKKVSDDSIVVALDVNDPEGYVYFDATTINLYYPTDLEYATEYYFLIDATAIEDTNGNTFAGIADPTTWSFTTLPAPPPATVLLDTAFVTGSGFDGAVRALAIDADGKILVGGQFEEYDGDTAVYIARLNTDGSLDDTFVTGAGFDGTVRALAIDADGKILVGGDFNTYDGDDAFKIARLNVDGSLDDTFVTGAGFDSTVQALAIDADGKILVGGQFEEYNGDTPVYIARLNTDGSFDDTFVTGTGFDDAVYSLAVDADGKILAGGDFFSYDGDDVVGVARLNTDGSLDDTFVTGDGFGSTVYALAIDADGKILAGGDFNTYDGDDAFRIARLNADGSLDDTFVTGDGFDNTVYTISIDGEDRIVIGGSFTTFNSEDTIRIVRLNADGSIDDTFVTGTGFDDVAYSFVLDADGNILAGGDFNEYDGDDAIKIARLIPPADEEETPPTDNEDNTGNNGSHRRSGGGGSSVPSNVDRSLLELLRSLIQQFIAQGGTPSPAMLAFLGTPTTTPGDYTRDLDIGDVGDDVRALQNFLIAQNKGPQAQALAANGATGFFGPLTQAALAEYQASVGITPAVGFFGPVTRAYVNGL